VWQAELKATRIARKLSNSVADRLVTERRGAPTCVSETVREMVKKNFLGSRREYEELPAR